MVLQLEYGEMVEWLKAPVLKTGDMKVSVGSNPTLSAKKKTHPLRVCFSFLVWIFAEWDRLFKDKELCYNGNKQFSGGTL